MYVLFLNVKRRGTPWLTNHLTNCPVSSRVVVMVQWLARPTSNQREAGSIPTHGNMFFIQSASSSLSLFVHSNHYIYIDSNIALRECSTTKELELVIYIERRVDYFLLTDLQACFVGA